MQYQISLASGVPKRQDFIGTNTNLILLDLGVATTVDMKIEVQGFGVEELQGIKRVPTSTGRFSRAPRSPPPLIASFR